MLLERDEGSVELDRRKQALLNAIVDTYVARAEPVGSEWLATSGNLGVRSATIRNELAEMTELGYLRQPHTSAGRIPSDLGYRYYVDHLMAWERRPPRPPPPRPRPLNGGAPGAPPPAPLPRPLQPARLSVTGYAPRQSGSDNP